MRIIFIVLAGTLFFAFGCKPVKKVQSIQSAISKKDTAQTIMVSEGPHVDSGRIVKDILGKVMSKKINFITFNAKIKVDYEGVNKKDHYTAYLGIRKDSAIFIQIKGTFLGIPALGLEVKITKDSVVLVYVLDKEIEYRSINYLQEASQIPFDFYTLQDLIVGNPVFLDSNVVSYKSSNSQLLVLMVGNIFKHLVTLDNGDFKVLHSKLDDVDLQRNRTCDITFSNYESKNGNLPFSTYRQISVAEKSKLDVYLDFKEYAFNEPLKYSFGLPKNYKRK
jgi:hypothetical protein